MAGADYYWCDICGCKTFYDACLNYTYDKDNINPETNHPWPDGNIGCMIVICKDCAKTHQIKIVKGKKGKKGE